MPRNGYKSISIPEEMLEQIEKLIKEEPTLGFKSKAAFIKEAISKLLKEYTPRFEHFNIRDDYATVIDNKLEKWVDVYWRGGKIFCDYCRKINCEHTRFLLKKEEFRQRLQELGIKIPKS